LMEVGEPGELQWAEELLTEVANDEDAHTSEKGIALELLAQIHQRRGHWDLAVEALQSCIEITSPTMNGTSGVPDLTLVEILLEHDPNSLPRITDLLNCQTLQERLRLDSDVFRYNLAVARTYQRLGQDPAPAACRALDLLEKDSPQFPRHPTVGRVQADEHIMQELRGLSKP
jgi:hypothetical protein